jgi:hypothetical protein
VHPLDESPKLDKLGEVLNRYDSRVTKFGYRIIIAESLLHHPFFALANVKNPWRDVFRLPTMNPRRMLSLGSVRKAHPKFELQHLRWVRNNHESRYISDVMGQTLQKLTLK